MKAHRVNNPTAWRPQPRLTAKITSLRQLQVFNDSAAVPVNFDIMRSAAPNIEIASSQGEALCFWETRSASGFVTTPKFNAELLTVRFVTSGQIAYRHGTGDAVGSPTHATLVGFEDLREVRASSGFQATSGTMAFAALVAANDALTGGAPVSLHPLAPVAEMSTPGMQALFRTIQSIQAKSTQVDDAVDLFLPLLQEIMSYQLLSAWPRRDRVVAVGGGEVSVRNFQAALDYIEDNLSGLLRLSDVAAAAGISVRSLQDKFRRRIGRTPVQYILDRRLQKVHQDLTSSLSATHSVAEIARRWGFVHMSDFGQRYRRSYGCSPVRTRRDAIQHH